MFIFISIYIYIYIFIYIYLSHETENKPDIHHHIIDILKKPIFIVVTIKTKGATESHVNNHF